MKKIVSLITMAAMLAVSTPAFAERGQRDYRWGNDRNVHSPYRGQNRVVVRERNRGVSTEGAIAIGIGALILGSAISNNRRNNRVVIENRQPRQVCQDNVQYDYYGNPYVAGRNCWYEQ
jgi:hypothetical protein